MTALVLTMPDESAALPGWLDRQIVGREVARLIAELTTIHGPIPSGSRRTVREVLGDRAPQVLARGLSAARPGVVSVLLKQPYLLLELQELVAVEGGSYWQALPRDAWLTASIADVWEAVQARLTTEVDPPPAEAVVVPAQPRIAWHRRPWIVGGAVAAAAFLSVATVFLLRDGGHTAVDTAGVGWGWGRADAIPTRGSADEYLAGLAAGADEWFAVTPDQPASLATRIHEFRVGCSRLIFADHALLSPNDKRWLVERCRAWAAQLDSQLQALEQGRPVAEVRAEVDRIARQITVAIRSRADTLRPAV